jgi:chemotaxis protein methyltransferase CheR
VEQDASGCELREMVDALTTNKTAFFREPDHFDFLRERLRAASGQGRRVRLWSAGCSSGEEAYSLAIVAREELEPQTDVRVLATDLSVRMLSRARRGVYSAAALSAVPAAVLRHHFAAVEGGSDSWVVHDDVRALVRVARLNLVERWPMRGPFDAIFCRNVMIYFDEGTRQRLIERFWELLAPGGHLFVGHSESLTALSHRFTYVRPAVYAR